MDEGVYCVSEKNKFANESLESKLSDEQVNKINVKIKEISLLEYMLECRVFSTPLSDYYVRNAMSTSVMSLLAAYVDGEHSDILGFCILNKAGFKGMNLEYILVREESRGQGIGGELLAAALQFAKERGNVIISARVVINDKKNEDLFKKGSSGFMITDKLLLQYGFQITTTSTIIRCANDEKSMTIWNEFMNKRGKKLIDRSERQGFTVVSFAKAGEMIDKLKESREEFPRELNPEFYICNPVDRLVPELSFIAVKNNLPVAYCIATTVDGKTIVFQQLSVALKYKRTGVFFLPFEAFMKQLFSEDTYSKVSYTVFDTNKEMKTLVDGFLNPLIESKKLQNFYRIKITGSERKQVE